jgi:hypothetical protein
VAPPKPEPDRDPPAPSGISQFLGKVLDQLSLSSWLPAVVLVGCGAVLVQLRSQRDVDLGSALVALTGKPLGILVVLLFAIVLAAVVSQAFAFGAIRLLEGYWAGHRGFTALHTIAVRCQLRRYDRAERRLDQLRELAFAEARGRMEAGHAPPHVIDIQAADVFVHADRSPDRWTAEQRADVRYFRWTEYCSAHHAERIGVLARRIREYPEPNRILPTRLGNILRATEDSLGAGDDLETWGLTRLDAVSARLQQHHEQFRTRLDMDCVLVFSSLLLAIAAAALLFPVVASPLGPSIAVAAFLGLAATCYSAALASARGYCSVLRSVKAAAESVSPVRAPSAAG